MTETDNGAHIAASPYSTGGGGTVLEHRYGAVLLAHLDRRAARSVIGAERGKRRCVS